MLTRIWKLFLSATLEETHCVDVIGGPSGLEMDTSYLTKGAWGESRVSLQ